MAKPSREYIYGLNPAFEVLRASRRSVYGAFLNEAARTQARIRKLVALLERQEVDIEWVDKGRVFQLAGSKDHQGVVLRTSPYPFGAFEDAIARDRVLLLDNVEDPHNVGAILRSAECFGFRHILMSQKGTPSIYPSVVKVSAGATEFLHIVRDRSANKYALALKQAGYHLAALDGQGSPLDDFAAAPRPSRLALVIGGEDRAVGQFILNQADSILAIPQAGRINSLNASVAAAIAMYALGTAPQTPAALCRR